MARRICAGLVCLLAFQCFFSRPTAAQVGNQCMGWFGNFWFPGPAPPGLFNCTYDGPWLTVCNMMRSACPPVAAPSEIPCPTCSQANPQGGKPIALATGNTFIKQTDVSLPGLGGGLNLVRTWNSMWPPTQTAFRVGMFGPNWRSTFEERIFVGSDNYIKYARGDGNFWSFGVGGPGYLVAAPANAGATLIWGSTNWTLTFPNGEQRLFNLTSGNLVSIIDRNGNTTKLTYDSINRLTTVTDPASRHLYFSYASGSSYLVTGVTSDFGVSLTYAYDSQGRLNQITMPDSSTISFQYDSNSNISAVLDSNGKILESHSYDTNGRGLTSSRANGVDALTITYASQ